MASLRCRMTALAIVVGCLAPAAPASAADTSKPSAPTGLVATATNTKTVTLTWTASRDNVGVTAYIVFRNGIEVGRSTSTSLTLSNQPASADLFFQVVAVDAAGNRSVKTAPATAYVDITKPSAPQGFWAFQTYDKSGQAPWAVMETQTPGPALFVGLNWLASTDDHGVTAYAIYRDGVEVAVVPPTLGFWDRPTAGLANQKVGVTNSYQVQAIDAAGNRSAKSVPSTACLCDVTPPAVPTNVVVERNGRGAVVSWDPPPPSEILPNQRQIQYGLLINGVRQRLILPDDCDSVLCESTIWISYQAWDAPMPEGPLSATPPLPTGRPLSFQVVAVDAASNMSVKSAPVTVTF